MRAPRTPPSNAPTANPLRPAFWRRSYTSGSLSKADVAAALKLVAQRLADGVKARRPVSLDLGAGTLSIRNGLAEFRFAPGGGAAAAGSSVCSSAAAPAAGAAGGSRVSGASQRRAVAAAAVAPGSQVSGQGSLHLPAGASCCGGGSRLTADVLLRHQQLQQGSRAASVLAGSALGKSRVSGAAAPRRPSAVPSAAAPAPASGPPQGAGGAGTLPAAVGGAGGQPASAGAKAKKPASVVQPPGAAAPASAAAMVQSVRAAREAAKANARTRVATFVLPCGGPGDEAAPAPQPQGRSKPAAARPVELPGTGDAGLPPAKAAAMRLAEERAAKERAARAQQEAEAVAGMAARKAALDAEAEAIKAELRKRKELLAVSTGQRPWATEHAWEGGGGG